MTSKKTPLKPLRKLKRTKIVATIGPVTENEPMMTALAQAGMNVVRLNFSHGSYEEHTLRCSLARTVSRKLKTAIAVLQDLSGPKIRIGALKGEKVELKEGAHFTLTTTPGEGDATRAFVSYDRLPQEVSAGGTILLRDGRVKLKVLSTTKKEILCKVVHGGEIKSRAGVNVPGAYLSMGCLTEKDRKDLKFGLEHDVDIIALSFVRRGSDVRELKEIIAKSGKDIRVMAKIETQEAIENIDEIIAESESIMVARGDLATECTPEEVPILQKMIIQKCIKAGKSVVVATQMLESMISSSTPTRAEVNDIANAILDGADAVMLSEETTLGKYPLEAVKVMARVAEKTEHSFPHTDFLTQEHLAGKEITDSVSYAATTMAHELKAKAIIALSVSGFTARMMSRHKPEQPIIVLTPNQKTYNRLAIKCNCYPVQTKMLESVSEAITRSKQVAREHGFVDKGDTVIIVAGIPFIHAGNTNAIFVQKIE